jgi:hypothetical protein
MFCLPEWSRSLPDRYIRVTPIVGVSSIELSLLFSLWREWYVFLQCYRNEESHWLFSLSQRKSWIHHLYRRAHGASDPVPLYGQMHVVAVFRLLLYDALVGHLCR